MGDVKIGDSTFTPSLGTIMADTGTSMNMVPDADYVKIIKFGLKDNFTGCY